MKVVRFLSRESHAVQRLGGSQTFFICLNTKEVLILQKSIPLLCFFTASYERNDTMYQINEINPLRIEKWLVFLHAFSLAQPLLFLVVTTQACSTPPSEKGVSWMLHVQCSMIYSEGSIPCIKLFFLNTVLSSFLDLSQCSVINTHFYDLNLFNTKLFGKIFRRFFIFINQQQF